MKKVNEVIETILNIIEKSISIYRKQSHHKSCMQEYKDNSIHIIVCAALLVIYLINLYMLINMYRNAILTLIERV